MTMLNGKRIAIVAAPGFEQSELFRPLEALRGAQAQVDIVSLEGGEIRGWDKKDWAPQHQGRSYDRRGLAERL